MNPNTPDEWFLIADQHEAAARAIVEIVAAAAQAKFHGGLGVEAALKGYIMDKEQLAAWPSRAVRRDLYTHDLEKLREIAGLALDPTTQQAAEWHVLLQWDRGQGYDPRPMPQEVARSWIEAAFGPNGLVPWIRRLCLHT